jgi:hypothetical protein
MPGQPASRSGSGGAAGRGVNGSNYTVINGPNQPGGTGDIRVLY